MDARGGESETATKHARLRDRNKFTINETSRLFAKAVEILRSDEKFTRSKISEVPFAIPNAYSSGKQEWQKNLI